MAGLPPTFTLAATAKDQLLPLSSVGTAYLEATQSNIGKASYFLKIFCFFMKLFSIVYVPIRYLYPSDFSE